MGRAGWVAVLGALAVLLAAPAGTSAKVHGTPQDRATTRAYLEARYAYEQSQFAIAPAAAAAVEAQAARLASECPGVLAGAPRQGLFQSQHSGPPLSPRQQGEANRESGQLSELQLELSIAATLPEVEADRPAALTFVHAVASLRWSDAAVTALEHLNAEELGWELGLSLPAACADMKTWASSGYKTLAPATKTLLDQFQAALAGSVGATRALSGAGLGSNPLARYEGPSERALQRRLDALESERLQRSLGLSTGYLRLEVAVGLMTAAEAERLEAAEKNSPPKGSIEIGHGSTAVGTSYTVWALPKKPGSRHSRACEPDVTVIEHRQSSGPVVLVTGGSRNESCLSRSHLPPASSQCDERRQTIEAQTLPAARTVRLNLSDGRHISSRVTLVPASLGGPAGYYYQVVRARSAYAVSLTELGAHAKVLRTVPLRGAHKCPNEAFIRRPGGVRTLARGSVPQGPGFVVIGERFSISGQSQFQLDIELAPQSASGGFFSSGSSESIPPSPGRRADPFAQQLQTGCVPSEYAIVYGVLKAPDDTVLVRTPAGLEPLQKARIPASLHVHGVLAYLGLPTVPSELLVRKPSGKIIYAQKFAARARTTHETCEGEAEPA